MSIIRFLNERVRRFNLLDVKLAQGIGIFVALIAAKLVPSVTDISIWWFVALLGLCAARPLYVILARQ